MFGLFIICKDWDNKLGFIRIRLFYLDFEFWVVVIGFIFLLIGLVF